MIALISIMALISIAVSLSKTNQEDPLADLSESYIDPVLEDWMFWLSIDSLGDYKFVRASGFSNVHQGKRITTDKLLEYNKNKNYIIAGKDKYILGKPDRNWLDYIRHNGFVLNSFNNSLN
jgi:hypothetical protein